MNAKRLTRSRASWRRAAATVVASAVEGLEPRRLLSTVTSTDLDVDGNPDLVITGTGGADTVNVYLNPHQLLGAQTIVQDVTTGKVYGFLLPFEAIEAHMLGGDDRLNVYVFDEYDEVTQGIHVDMGSGKDKFTFSSPILANSPATTPNAADGANLGDDINFPLLRRHGGSSHLTRRGRGPVLHRPAAGRHARLRRRLRRRRPDPHVTGGHEV